MTNIGPTHQPLLTRSRHAENTWEKERASARILERVKCGVASGSLISFHRSPPCFRAGRLLSVNGTFVLNSTALCQHCQGLFPCDKIIKWTRNKKSWSTTTAAGKWPIFVRILVVSQISSHSFYLLGHQLGLDVHCLAICSALCVGSLVFVVSQKRLPGLPWWGLVLMALPLAYDRVTQLIGLRQSTWEICLLTSALFGFGAAWVALPWLHKTIQENLPRSFNDRR